MSNYDDDRARTRYWDESGKTELAYGTPYELAAQVHQLRTALAAERTRREHAEAVLAIIEELGPKPEQMNAIDQQQVRFFAARAAWLAARAPGTAPGA